MTPESSKRLRAALPASLVVVVVAVVVGVFAFRSQPAPAKPKNKGSTTSTTRVTPSTVILPTDDLSTAPPAAEGRWRMLRSFTFTGDKLDTSIWSTCYPQFENPASGCTNFGNRELEWYLPSQVAVSGGALHLVAARTPTGGKTSSGAVKTYSWRSGMVTTYRSFKFRYGYVLVRARYPVGPGFWSALWLLDAQNHPYPEIDLEESTGGLPHNVLVKAHYFSPRKARGGNPNTTALDVRLGWHDFAVDWEPTFVAWYIDGHLVQKITRFVPKVPMFFLANLAVDGQVHGRAPTTPTPPGCVPSATRKLCTPPTGNFDVSSVEVWQRDSQGS